MEPPSYSEHEGRIQFVLENFSKLAEVAYSKCISVESTLWRLMIVKNDAVTNSQGSKAGKYLGAFLQCVTGSPPLSQDWSMPVRSTIKLLNPSCPDKSYSKDFEHTFSATSKDWGFSAFMKLKDILDPVKGFLKNDALEFHAKLSLLSCKKEKRDDHNHDCLMAGLSCPLCCGAFHTHGSKQPMSLKCGHTFCLDCLQTTSSKTSSDNKHSIRCSQCDKDHVGSSDDDKLWFPNYSMIQLIGNVIPKSKHFCPTHQHDKSYYCFNDQCLVCIYCAYHGEHKTHECKHVDEARQQVELSLQEVKRKVSGKAAELERHLQLLNDEQKLLKSQENHVTSAVNDFYSQIEAVLHRQKEMTLKELKMHTSELCGAVETQTSDLQKQCSIVQQGLSQYTTWQSLPSQEALGDVAALKSQLLSISAIKLETASPNVPSTNISVELPSVDVFTTLSNLGKLTFVSKTSSMATEVNDSSTSQPVSSQSISNGVELPPAKKRKSAY